MNYPEQKEELPQVNEPDLNGYYTARDFISWTFEGLAELINGRIFKMTPAPFPPHQIVSANLFSKFYQYFDNKKCSAFHAPADVFLVKDGQDYKDTRNIVEPDIFVICDPHKITSKAIIGPPDLIIEILSTWNARHDLKTKMALYEEYDVPEYWVADPENKTITIFELTEAKRYKPHKPCVMGDTISSVQFDGLSVKLKDVFKNLPIK